MAGFPDKMIFIVAIPAWILIAGGVIYFFAEVFAVGWNYAQDRLKESELVKESHPKLSASLRFW